MLRYLFAYLFVCTTVYTAWAQEICPVIPQPVSAEKRGGFFRLDKHTSIRAEGLASICRQLSATGDAPLTRDTAGGKHGKKQLNDYSSQN